ncbi:hypothetical protein PG993_014026 [Apiospora rasikravindrae]|uniref:Uncharacterized protein n=1 Tax=Apiospora rasikravindrae TaxID=990691 RepID=A0ABR1RRW5_9PEZI
MSSPDTTTAAPSLPGNWVPSKAGCLNKNDWWIWSYDGPKRDARTVLGGPSQTNNCFPSTGDPTGTYTGSQCPPNYTRACPDSSVADAAVTCCPTAYNFSCVPEPFTVPHLDFFRCMSEHGTTGSPTITLTDFQANTQKIIQPKQASHEHLFAIAMVYTTPAPTSASTPGPTASASSGDAPPPLPSETGSSPSSGSHGLSAGASGGIGVGAGVGVLLLAVVAFFLYRRGRGTRGKTELPTSSPSAGPTVAPPTAMMAQNTASTGFVQNGTGGAGYGEHSAGTYGTGDVSYWDATVKHEAPLSTPSPVATSNTVVPGRHEMGSGDPRSELPSYRQ